MENPFTIPDEGRAATPEERAEARAKLRDGLARALTLAAQLPEVAPLVLVQGCWHALMRVNVLHDRLPKVGLTPTTGEDLIDARQGLRWCLPKLEESAAVYGRDAHTLVSGLSASLSRLPGDVLGRLRERDELAGANTQDMHYHGPFAGLPLDESDSVYCDKSLRSVDND